MENALKKLENKASINRGYLVGLAFLLIACLVTLYTNRQLVRQSLLVTHTQDIITIAESMMSQVKDAETGARGYVVTRDSTYLQPYIGSRKIIDSLYKELAVKTADNKQQTDLIRALKPTLDARLDMIEEGLVLFNQHNKMLSEGSYILAERGKRVMDSIRRIVLDIQTNEKALLDKRSNRLDSNYSALNIVTIGTIIMAIGILVFGYIRASRENKARWAAERKIINYQQELKERVEQLAKANTELVGMRSQEKFAATGRMARTIAHEVRNPLTNINLAVDQLKGELAEQDENTGFLFDMINRNSNRINQLISDLLNSTKFSDLTFSKISVNKLLDEALAGAEDRITLSNVVVEKKYTGQLCDILVDEGRLKIALLNIIINAVEAMEGSPVRKLLVETMAENNKCKIIITDTGSGMDEEALSKIFEPYFTSKQKGNGLGLTNTQNIILNHKGDISVQSKPGAGTSFTIILGTA